VVGSYEDFILYSHNSFERKIIVTALKHRESTFESNSSDRQELQVL